MLPAFCGKNSATRKITHDGFFSGWNPEKRAYDTESWLYEGDGLSFPQRDLTLQHPRCVFQTLKRHYARYTPEMVEKVCGIPPELFHKVADALVTSVRAGQNRGDLLRGRLDPAFERRADHSDRGGLATVVRQHRPAWRRHSRLARARFHPGLDRYSDALRYSPGYLAMPRGGKGEDTLAAIFQKAHQPDRALARFPEVFR